MDTAGEGAVEQNDGNQHSDLNLSDVLRVLDAEGTLEAHAEVMARPQRALSTTPQRPEVRIVEQPAPKALRFRYECEGRSAGSILGVNSTSDRKTYPTIEIRGYTGPVLVLVCCVTTEPPYKPHPHNLVGNDCKNGVLRMRCDITPENRTVSFTKLGVQCVKRKDVADALDQRMRDKIDPYRTRFEHRNSPQSINLNAVRLCFQVLMPDEEGMFRRAMTVASDVVYDKKAMSELHIARVSACTGSAKGGLQMIMLCDKVSREEISVVFEEVSGERVVWRDNAVVDHVHKQYAIVCTVPAYRTPNVNGEVETYLFLERRSDMACSNKIKFTYLPDVTYADYLNGKKRKMLDRGGIESYELDRAAAAYVAEAQVKQEPRDVGRSPRQMMSPQYPDYRVNTQQWNMPAEVAGPGTFQYTQLPGMHQVGLELQSLSMDPRSPSMQATSPLMHAPAHSPHMQSPSPHYQTPSPHMHVTSPHMQVLPSPHYQAPSPNMQAPSPNMQVPSPHMHMLPTTPADHTLMSAGVLQQPVQQLQLQQQQQQGQQPLLVPVSMDNIPMGDISLTSLLGYLGADSDIGDGQPLHQ